MYLLFLSKYFVCGFIWGSSTHNGDKKTLSSCLYPIKYLNDSLTYDFLPDNAILLISTLLILIGFLFLWKVLLICYFHWNVRCLVLFLYYEKKKGSIIIFFNFSPHGDFLWYSFIFCFFFDICFFHIFAFHFFFSSDEFLYLSLACCLNLSLSYFK